ncbi:MAG: protein kinase [Gemmataceae bacterium]
MSDIRPDPPADSGADDDARIDECCARFEQAWLAGPRPEIEAFLGAQPASPRLVVRLIALDVAHRARTGETPCRADYQDRFPGLDLAWLDGAPVTRLTATTGFHAAPATPELPGASPLRRLCCPHCHNTVARRNGHGQEVHCSACGSSFRLEVPQEPTTVGPLRQLGRFQLLGQVGRGGFGTVWKAYDTRLDRVVALKVPHAGSLELPSYLERLHREARAAAQLRHPGIVRLYEVVTLEEGPVLVSDFIDGAPLRELMATRRLTFREAAALVADVAEALDYAHNQGLVHRDVKPGNIMMEVDRANPPPRGVGKPIVVDFGLALRDEAEIVMTVEGQIVGTPAYMSPEQASGQNRQVDRRSDVYSLGVVLYELLCGEQPFRGAKAMLLQQVRHEEPRPPRRLNDKIPRDLETIGLKALAKEQTRRYPTAGAFAADLRRYLAGDPIQARPVGRAERAWRWALRNPALAGAAGLLAVAVVIVVALSVAFMVHQARALREARRYTATLALNQGLTHCTQGDCALGVLWLARGVAVAPEDDADLQRVLRANLAAWSRELPPLHAALERPSRVSSVVFSPDSQTLLVGDRDGKATLWDVATGVDLGRALDHGAPVLAVAFSPDGGTVATAGQDGAVCLWDAAAARRLDRWAGHQKAVTAVAFHPDGQAVATAGVDQVARVWDRATGRCRYSLPHPHRVNSLVFCPDRPALVTGCEDGVVRLWDTTTGQQLSRTFHHGPGLTALALETGGRALVTAGMDGRVHLWDVNTGERQRSFSNSAASVYCVAFSPDGRTLVTGASDKLVRFWESATGRPCGPPLRHRRTVEVATLSPDGKWLATGEGGGEVLLRQAAPGQGLRTIVAHPDPVGAVQFHPDGTRLLTSSKGKKRGQARLWEADTGRPLGPPIDHQDSVAAQAFSPDGQTFVVGSWDRTARFVQPATGRTWVVKHPGPVKAVAFHPSGLTALTAGGGHVAVPWDAATGQPAGQPLKHEANVTAAVYSPDGHLLLTGCEDSQAYLWDAEKGALLHTLQHDGPVYAVAASPDGRRLLTGSFDKTARLWDTASGAAVGEPLTHEDGVLAVAFTPDGRHAVTASQDKTARVWEAATGRPTGLPMVHRGEIGALAVSPDGALILTGSFDHTAQLWDAATGRPVGPPLPHPNRVLCLAFNPKGPTLATGGLDGAVRLWRRPGVVEGEASRVTAWVESLLGLEMDDTGAVRVLSGEAWLQRRQAARGLGLSPDLAR